MLLRLLNSEGEELETGMETKTVIDMGHMHIYENTLMHNLRKGIV